MNPYALSAAIALALVTQAHPQVLANLPPRIEPATLSLEASRTRVRPGEAFMAALVVRLAPGWHTYWRNPGDAGEQPELTWRLPPGWSVSPIIWPTPTAQPQGPTLSYGYTREVYLPIKILPPANLRPGARATLGLEVWAMSCKDMCVPTRQSLTLEITSGRSVGVRTLHSAKIEQALAAAPRHGDLDATFTDDGGRLTLTVRGDALARISRPRAFFYPYARHTIQHAAVQPVSRVQGGLALELSKPAGAAPPESLAGVLLVDGKAFEIRATRGERRGA